MLSQASEKCGLASSGGAPLALLVASPLASSAGQRQPTKDATPPARRAVRAAPPPAPAAIPRYARLRLRWRRTPVGCFTGRLYPKRNLRPEKIPATSGRSGQPVPLGTPTGQSLPYKRKPFLPRAPGKSCSKAIHAFERFSPSSAARAPFGCFTSSLYPYKTISLQAYTL